MGKKYFLYSDEQIKEKNEIYKKVGKVFKAGTVVVNGVRKSFTQLSDNKTIPRCIDTKVIAEGDPNSMTYTMPTVEIKKGN